MTSLPRARHFRAEKEEEGREGLQCQSEARVGTKSSGDRRERPMSRSERFGVCQNTSERVGAVWSVLQCLLFFA